MPRTQTFSDPTRFAAVVLAAGASRRMGEAKALLPFGDGPLIEHVVRNCIAPGFISPVVVVTGHEPDLVQSTLHRLNVRFIHNHDYDAGGMISSIQRGLRSVAAEADAVFIVLGDQPCVRSQTFIALKDAWHARRAVVRPTVEGRSGHPVLIGAGAIDMILQLPPDATLKDFVHQHAEHLIAVPVDDPAVLFDIDTPADYRRALEVFANQTRSSRCQDDTTRHLAAAPTG